MIRCGCTGLRPGEKLYEELLLEADSEPTTHPLIYRAREAALPPETLWPQLDALEDALRARDEPAALALLAQLVPEWQRGGDGVVPPHGADRLEHPRWDGVLKA